VASIPEAGAAPRSNELSIEPTRSADFGTFWELPEPISDIPGRFTWLCPHPDPSHTRYLPQLRDSVDLIAIPYNAVIDDPDNPYALAIDHATVQSRDWFMYDDNGQIVRTDRGQPLCDPAKPGYAEAWADEAIRRAKSFNADYLFVDSVDQRIRWTTNHVVQVRYNDDALWQDTLYNFLTVVVQRAHQAGLKVAFNMGATSWTSGPMARFANLADAVLTEYFMLGGDREQMGAIFQSSAEVDKQISEVQAYQGKALLVTRVQQNDPEYDRKATYGLAAYLVARKPGDVFIFYNVSTSGGKMTHWQSSFAAAAQLGPAVDGPTKIGGLWVRHYRYGTVVLNATGGTLPVPAEAGSEAAALGSLPAHSGAIVPKP